MTKIYHPFSGGLDYSCIFSEQQRAGVIHQINDCPPSQTNLSLIFFHHLFASIQRPIQRPSLPSLRDRGVSPAPSLDSMLSISSIGSLSLGGLSIGSPYNSYSSVSSAMRVNFRDRPNQVSLTSFVHRPSPLWWQLVHPVSVFVCYPQSGHSGLR